MFLQNNGKLLPDYTE